jgi:hypothetical protein
MAHFCYNFIEFNAKPYVQPKGWYQYYEIVIFVFVLTKCIAGQTMGICQKNNQQKFLTADLPWHKIN